MTDPLKLHEITPFLINYATKRLKDSSLDDLDNIYTDSRRWFDWTSVILKLTRMPSISAMELTLKLLPVIHNIEESAQLVYDLYSTILQEKTLVKEEVDLSDLLVGPHGFNFFAKLVNTSKIFLVLKQEEEEVSKPQKTILLLPDLPNGQKAVKRYIELEFA